MEENSFNGTIITFDELKNAVKEGEVFLTPAEFAKKIKTSEKALRQMRWRSKKGLGRNHYPYYQFGRKVLYPLSLFIQEGRKAMHKKGGNVEKPMEAKGDGSAKKELMKLAKDEADILFDLENDIVEQLKLDYLKEGGKGQTFMDWLKSKPESYLRNLPIGLAAGGKVISISEYLKQKEKPKIKKLDLDSVAPGKALSELTEAEREVVLNLLRMTFKD